MAAIAASFWDYWTFNHKVNFDGVNKIAIVSPGVTSLDVQIELFSDWKEWVKIRQNTKYDSAMRSIGGDPTTGVNFAGDSYFMINNWRVAVDLTKVRITGILFSDDFESAWLGIDKVAPVFPAEVASLVNRVGTDTAATASAVWQHSNNGETYASAIDSIQTGGTGLTITQAAQIADIFTVLGLDPTKPLIVTPSTISAGSSVTQTISGDPVSSTIVQRT